MVDRRDISGRTPLLWAAGNGHEAVMKLLLARKDVSVNSEDEGSRSPLSWAAGNGHEAVVKLLLARKDIQVNSEDKSGRTPLLWAAENGHEATVYHSSPRTDFRSHRLRKSEIDVYVDAMTQGAVVLRSDFLQREQVNIRRGFLL